MDNKMIKTALDSYVVVFRQKEDINEKVREILYKGLEDVVSIEEFDRYFNGDYYRMIACINNKKHRIIIYTIDNRITEDDLSDLLEKYRNKPSLFGYEMDAIFDENGFVSKNRYGMISSDSIKQDNMSLVKSKKDLFVVMWACSWGIIGVVLAFINSMIHRFMDTGSFVALFNFAFLSITALFVFAPGVRRWVEKHIIDKLP